MKAIVLAAGYATRMHPLTLNTAKSLLDISGKLIIERIVDKLAEVGEIEKIFIITNDKFYLQFVWWLGKYAQKGKVEIVNDNTISQETRLGAMGDIDFLINEKGIDEDIVVVAGDNLFTMPLKDFVSFGVEKSKPCIGVYDVFLEDMAKNFGVVKLDENKKIISLQEKPDNPESTLISTTCYFFPRQTILTLKKYISEGMPKDRLGDFVAW
ncbi:MAG: nucleotidyltransferase family protein, partial [Nanoarchaeota archaeon]